ncbi:monosaccharide ABC transporter substrate-binding protein (CUT2 family) [Anaerobacterium chartisolvens]|uniref:Monosaccharide ABC transporter substrate-binding protein (CUT2 family) n=1 Tax=Anaerobacterium chartisolvens TaxID=1297424 RepID=A0A369B582_9FIRM|nr:ABC transporter substrate-binding protein [Anaerobacterium chartisolvens]RCX14844.1 monosaccharide ABC transporter substrate-binding protein (CUT2 family) [Anaerobacterium chartisolvens]
MKMLSKFTAVALALTMLLSLAACGGNAKPSGGNEAEATKAEVKDQKNGSGKKVVVGFSQIGAESEWRTANTKSIKDACEEAGFELKFSDALQKQENQIKAIRSFIAQKVDYIALAPVVETGWDTVLKEVADAKIPLILVDRSVKTADGKDDLWITRVGENFYEEGKNLAEWVKNNEEKLGFKGKDTVNVYQLEGTVGSGAAIDRGQAWVDTMEGTKFKTIKSQTGDFTRAKGQEVMESWLKSDKGKIDLIYAHNDDMALGAISAIEAAGLNPGVDIKIVSIDGVKGAFEAMIAGKLNCVAECSPLTGPVLVQTISDLEAGKEVPKLTYAKEEVFPAEKAAEILPSRQY